jgi:hypothetical protein
MTPGRGGLANHEDDEGGTMPNKQSPAFSLNSKQVIIGGALIGAGAVICLSGFAVSGSALLAAVRGWLEELEEPPSVVMRRTWSQTRKATAAGARAWRDEYSSQQNNAA